MHVIHCETGVAVAAVGGVSVALMIARYVVNGRKVRDLISMVGRRPKFAGEDGSRRVQEYAIITVHSPASGFSRIRGGMRRKSRKLGAELLDAGRWVPPARQKETSNDVRFNMFLDSTATVEALHRSVWGVSSG